MKAVRTYLEMRADAPRPAAAPAPNGARVQHEKECPPALWRRLYQEVGTEYRWFDRLVWSDDDAAAYLSSPGVELWTLRLDAALAGYFELRRDADGGIEIAYFGLLPEFTGRGLGGFLLAAAIERAWALEPDRVWVHTSSLDHSSALPNYLARGFSIWKQEVYDY